jgi:hypothetical protein
MITAAAQENGKGTGISVYTEDVQRTRCISVTGGEVLTGFTGSTVTTLDKKSGTGRIYNEEGQMIRFFNVKPQEDEEETYSCRPSYSSINQNFASSVLNLVALVIAIAFFYTFGHQIMVTGCTPVEAIMYATGVFALGGLAIAFVVFLLVIIFIKIKTIFKKS